MPSSGLGEKVMTGKNGRNLRVGINGFGRIGRAVFRVLEHRSRHHVVHVNDLVAANAGQVRYLTSFDSLYGRFPGDVTADDSSLTIHRDGGRDPLRISLSSSRSTLQVDWRRRGVEVVIEATGSAEAIADCRHLLDTGISYVVVTSNFNQADATVIPGVHSAEEFPLPGALISAATCDVVAAGPLVHAILSLGCIEYMRIVTIHPWLNYQPLLDASLAPAAGAVNQGNFGLGRAATVSVVPKSTSLEFALTSIFSALEGRIRAHSYRVPTPVVCYGDMSVDLGFRTTREEVLHAIAQKAPVVGVTEDALVSVDFIADHRAAVVDMRWLQVDQTRLTLVYAYDNEWGYANYVAEILNRIADQMGD
jgi:glyceraldehyde 3-phosphate dehydrogenase